MDLSDVKAEAARLGVWVHLATVSPSGTPYVSPVHPAWEGDTLWTMFGTDSVKAKNVAVNPKVTCHWQVSDQTGFDSLIVWGHGQAHDDVETKRRLWDGVFDYDLGEFAPDGPDDAPGIGFLAITPRRAVLLRQYGMGGRDVWRAGE